MLLFLIGYMGCGKSTVGKILAKDLGYNFIDLDELIEKNKQQSINQIFNEQGEDGFRIIERENLLNAFSLKNTIVSTGGGAPCFFDNMEKMNQQGKTIYLKFNPEILAQRLLNGRDQRPIISNKTDEELLSFIEGALQKRAVFYNQAAVIVEGGSKTPHEIVRLIKQQL